MKQLLEHIICVSLSVLFVELPGIYNSFIITTYFASCKKLIYVYMFTNGKHFLSLLSVIVKDSMSDLLWSFNNKGVTHVHICQN